MPLLCPLLNKLCVQKECEWFAVGINRCMIVALGMLSEEMHDMGVYSYEKYVKEEGRAE